MALPLLNETLSEPQNQFHWGLYVRCLHEIRQLFASSPQTSYVFLATFPPYEHRLQRQELMLTQLNFVPTQTSV